MLEFQTDAQAFEVYQEIYNEVKDRLETMGFRFSEGEVEEGDEILEYLRSWLEPWDPRDPIPYERPCPTCHGKGGRIEIDSVPYGDTYVSRNYYENCPDCVDDYECPTCGNRIEFDAAGWSCMICGRTE